MSVFPRLCRVWYARRFVLFFFWFASALTASEAFGGTIEGKILDQKSSEPLTGARVAVVGTRDGALSGLDGFYSIHKLPRGSYSLRVSYTGYEPVTVSVTLDSDDAHVVENISLAMLASSGREVTVSASADHGSDASVQRSVQHADNVLTAVSARTIEVSPDLSVADASRRLSGVSVSRTSSGDGEYAIIRGMDKRYNYTLINGVKIPSPDNKNRYVPLDIFPSELIQRLEVTKSLLPSMEGDAIGGAMNLVMKQAPDRFIATAQAGSGYDGLYFSRKFNAFDFNSSSESPRVAHGLTYAANLSDFPTSSFSPHLEAAAPSQYLAATIGNRFFDDQRLGVLVSGSYQNSSRGANTVFFQNTVDQESNTPNLTDLENRTYSTQQQRAGVVANIDYRLGDEDRIGLFGVYANLKTQEQRDLFDTVLGLGWPQALRVVYHRRSTLDEQSIANSTLSGTQTIFGKDLVADWKLVYSRASWNQPDRAQLDLYTGGTLDTTGRYIASPTFVNEGSTRAWSSNVDQDKSLYLTLRSTEDIFGTSTEFSYGGIFRAKNRSSLYDSYNLRPDNTYSFQRYNGSIASDTFSVFDPYGTSTDPLNYDAHENVTGGFLQAKFQVGNFQTVGGVRVENTDFGWATQAPVTMPGKTGSIQYLDILPSVNFKYSPVEDQNWRLSYFRSISRPGFFEVIPNNGVPSEDYTEMTNPYLNRTQANNLDVRWEYFPGGLDQFLVGAFYKNIHDPIEYTVVEVKTSSFLEPQNFGTATNYGFELDLRKYFSVFGVQANYTFTKSSITTDKSVKYRDPVQGLTIRTTQQTRPLQGQSEHIGNLSLLYKDFENGTDAQLGLVYTGPAIVTVSPYLDNDVWQTAVIQLDFSAEQKLGAGLVLYAKVNNILNSPREEVIHMPYITASAGTINYQTAGQDVLIRREYYDRTYIFGLRYKL